MWMTLTDALCECNGCVCVCARVCVSPTVYAYKKKALVCVCLCVVHVCHWDHVCEFAISLPNVDACASDLVCLLCVSVYVCVVV